VNLHKVHFRNNNAPCHVMLIMIYPITVEVTILAMVMLVGRKDVRIFIKRKCFFGLYRQVDI